MLQIRTQGNQINLYLMPIGSKNLESSPTGSTYIYVNMINIPVIIFHQGQKQCIETGKLISLLQKFKEQFIRAITEEINLYQVQPTYQVLHHLPVSSTLYIHYCLWPNYIAPYILFAKG